MDVESRREAASDLLFAVRFEQQQQQQQQRQRQRQALLQLPPIPPRYHHHHHYHHGGEQQLNLLDVVGTFGRGGGVVTVHAPRDNTTGVAAAEEEEEVEDGGGDLQPPQQQGRRRRRQRRRRSLNLRSKQEAQKTTTSGGRSMHRRKQQKKRGAEAAGGPPRHYSPYASAVSISSSFPFRGKRPSVRLSEEVVDERFGGFLGTLASLRGESQSAETNILRDLEAAKATIPLSFLFQQNMDAYCMLRGMGTIVQLLTKLLHDKMRRALNRWRRVVKLVGLAVLNRQERDHAFLRALNLINEMMSHSLAQKLSRGLALWRANVRRICEVAALAGRHHAALAVQGQWRMKRARKRRQLLQRRADAEHLRRQKLRDDVIRAEGRVRSDLRRVRKYAEHMARLRYLASLLAAEETRAAMRIQRRYRDHLAHMAVLRKQEERRSAILLQTRFRILQDRRRFLVRRDALRAQKELERVSSTTLQAWWRGQLGRARARARKARIELERRSAARIQMAYRRKQGSYALYLKFAARRQILDEERRASELAAHMKFLREMSAAETIQRSWLCYRARVRVSALRWERDSNNAALKLQGWYRRVTGKFALHLKFMAQREKLDAERKAAAKKLEELYVIRRARKEAAKRRHDKLVFEEQTAAAKDMQGRARIFLARRKVQAVRDEKADKERRAATMMQCVYRQKQARGRSGDRRVYLAKLAEEQRIREFNAAARLQSVFRGGRGRGKAAQRRKHLRMIADREAYSATLLGAKFRAHHTNSAYRCISAAMRVHDYQCVRYGLAPKSHEAPLLLRRIDEQRGLTVADALRTRLPELTGAQIACINTAVAEAEDLRARESESALRLQNKWRFFRSSMKLLDLWKLIANARKSTRDELIAKLQREHDKRERAASNIQRIYRSRLGRIAFLRARELARDEDMKRRYLQDSNADTARQAWLREQEETALRGALLKKQRLALAEEHAQQAAEIARWNADEKRWQVEALALEEKKKQDELAGFRKDRWPSEQRDAALIAAALALGKCGWIGMYDPANNFFFFNIFKKVRSWELPHGMHHPDWQQFRDEKSGDPNGYFYSFLLKEYTYSMPTEADCKRCTLVRMNTSDAQCINCNNRVAVVACEQCRESFCAICYSTAHRGTYKKLHTFYSLKDVIDRHAVWRCVDCGLFATRECLDCSTDARLFCETCWPASHSLGPTKKHNNVHFREGAALCCECGDRLALRHCGECGDYCEDCVVKTHKHRDKSDHVLRPIDVLKQQLGAGEEYCVICSIRAVDRLCNLCDDSFCMTCFEESHNKGKLRDHTWTPWGEVMQKADWMEVFDSEQKRPLWFNTRTRESLPHKPLQLYEGREKHEAMRKERDDADRAHRVAQDSELVAMRSEIEQLKSKIVLLEAPKFDAEAAKEGEGDDGSVEMSDITMFGELRKIGFGEVARHPIRFWTRVRADQQERVKEQQAAYLKEMLASPEFKRKANKQKNTFGTKQYGDKRVNDLRAIIKKQSPDDIKGANLLHPYEEEKLGLRKK